MKKMFLFLGILFSLSLTHFSHAQDGFSKLYTYDSDGLEFIPHIIPKVIYDSTTNALYFPLWANLKLKDEPSVIRYSVLSRTDTNGIIIKQVIDTIGGHHIAHQNVIVSADKQYLYWTSNTYLLNIDYDSMTMDYFITKTDMDLNIIWKKSVFTPNVYYCRTIGITEDDNGDLTIAGYEYTDTFSVLPELKPRIRLLKVDSAGSFIWTKILGDSLFNNTPISNTPYHLIQNENKDYLVVGSTTGYGASNTSSIIFKADENGNELWHQIYMQNYYYDQIADFVRVKSPDESYINIGYSKQHFNSSEYSNFISRIDKNGNELWRQLLNSKAPGFQAITTIPESSDVLFTDKFSSTSILGSPSNPTSEAQITRMDTLGNKIWSRKFLHVPNENKPSVIYDVITLPSGSIIAVGTAFSEGGTVNFNKGWMLKVNKNGCLFDDCRDVVGLETVTAEKNSIIVYPNPTSGKISIFQKTPFANGTQINVYDISDLNPNSYILQIKNGNMKIQKKLNLIHSSF